MSEKATAGVANDGIFEREHGGSAMGRRSWERRRDEGIASDPAARRPLLVLGTIAVGMLALTAVTWAVLDAAAADTVAPPSVAPVYLAGAFCLLVSCMVVVVHGTRTAHRVAGPEHRLIQSLRRVRTGDLAFRVSLRRGDLLSDLASECNALIEHLNQHPPAGAKTGSDVVEVVHEVEARDPVVEEARP